MPRRTTSALEMNQGSDAHVKEALQFDFISSHDSIGV